MSQTPDSIETIEPHQLARALGGVNWARAAKVARALRDGALELWNGEQIPRIEHPLPNRPPVVTIDPRPAPKPPTLPGNLKIRD
jgi:hypothetical protein